jgi:hypothetical protein
MFVWRNVSQAGYFVFTEATVIVSRTPSPGLASSTDGRDCAPADGVPDHPVFSPETQERLAQQVGAVNFRGGRTETPSERRWCTIGLSWSTECACSGCRLERGEPAL